jgi:hypothetical protein
MGAPGKRWLYLLHRWLGIATCLLMGLWFFSGVVMMYVGYPKLTPLERLGHLPALNLQGCCVSAATALARAGIKGAPEEMTLAMVGSEPAYLVRERRGAVHALRATDGARLTGAEPQIALDNARAFLPGFNASHEETAAEDAWTHSRALDAHRPLHRVVFDDPQGTELYVSSRTGEVVRDSTRVERGWNYAGAWLHWLYMFRGNQFDRHWTDIIIWTSLLGTVMAVIGTWVGVLRWRFRGRYASASHSPYREAYMYWHHLLGLAFALVTITWALSGLLSVNPWKIFSTDGPPADIAAFSRGVLQPEAFTLAPAAALDRLNGQLSGAREIAFAWFDRKPHYIVYDAAGRSLIVPGDGNGEVRPMFDLRTLEAAAARLLPGSKLVEVQWLNDYDNWYYPRAQHTMLGHIERRLPVLRVQFDDPLNTLFHIDPYTASVHNRIDDGRRWSRWLFAALHSWDIRGLVDRRPLWDVLMVAFSAGGFALCITGTVIAWRRLRRYQHALAQVGGARPRIS